MNAKAIKPLSLLVCMFLLFSFTPVDSVRGVYNIIIDVDTTADGYDESTNGVCSAGDPTEGPCTLRAAIDEANFANTKDANVTINLPSGHYTLTIPPNTVNDIDSGDLNIIATDPDYSITINVVGSEPAVIDANQLDRVLYIDGGGLVTLNNVVIQRGYLEVTGTGIYGAGIYNTGNLALNHVIIEDNMLEYLGGSYCPYWSYGGGIYNGGPLQIVDSTIQFNTSPHASALYNGSEVSIEHSTIRGNYASGANTIKNFGTVNIINSTIAENTSNYGVGGVGIENYGTLVIFSSTFSNSGIAASIEHRSGSVTVKDSIFNSVPNQAGISYNCFFANDSLALISLGHNIFSDDTCQATGPNDLSNTDPLLGELGWWGGPTMTMPLLQGSPAVDHRNGVCSTFVTSITLEDDQRYHPRNDGKCDTGAFEGSVTIGSIFLPLIIR